MQDFTYQLNYDEQSYTVMGYRGDAPEVTIPETFGGKPVTILYDKLFSGHAELRAVHIPDAVTDLGEFLFDGCANLRRLELPARLVNLWGYTFVRCGLEEIALPDGVKAIPPYAFKDCKDLRRVACGAGMRKIYAWAFSGCNRLAELACGPDVEISADAFATNPDILRV